MRAKQGAMVATRPAPSDAQVAPQPRGAATLVQAPYYRKQTTQEEGPHQGLAHTQDAIDAKDETVY